jgi:FkbM family methyltransferase
MSVIFDVGSCDGMDAIKYQQLFPLATMYAFEPVHGNYELLLKNLDTHGCLGIRTFRWALSNCAEEVKMFISTSDSTLTRRCVQRQSSSLLRFIFLELKN